MRRRGTRPRPLILARASSAWTSAGAGGTRYKGPVSVAPPALLPDGTLLRPLVAHADERGVFTELYRLEWETGVTPIQWNAVRSEAGVLRGVHVHVRHRDYLTLPYGRAVVGLRDLTARVPDRGPERSRRAERRRARLARHSVRRCARLLLPRALAARLRRHRVLEPRRRAGLPLGRSGAGAQLAGPVSSGFGPGRGEPVSPGAAGRARALAAHLIGALRNPRPTSRSRSRQVTDDESIARSRSRSRREATSRACSSCSVCSSFCWARTCSCSSASRATCSWSRSSRAASSSSSRASSTVTASSTCCGTSVAPSRIAHASRPRVELVQPLLAAPAAALPARKVEDGCAGAADGAAAGHREDLLPHVEVARQLLGAGPPPRRQPPVELERVPGAAVGHAVLAAQEQLAVEGELEVDAPVVDAPVRVDPERQRMGEIALGEKRLERLDVLR